MPAINGVRKRATSIRKGQGSISSVSILITVLITILVTLGIVLGLWKFVFQQRVYDKFIAATSDVQTTVYVATRDIMPGESITDAISLQQVPSTVAVSDAVFAGLDISDLRASRTILAKSIVTSTNTYDPATQDTVLTSSRFMTVGGLDSTNVNIGDYVDIRLKKSSSDSAASYNDWIVVSKKEILGKGTDGSLIMMLSESEIMNLNSAILEEQNNQSGNTVKVYLAKYVDPVNQPKATVTYTGAGSKYTQAELAEAQERIANINNGEEEYRHPEAVTSAGIDTSSTADETGEEDVE